MRNVGLLVPVLLVLWPSGSLAQQPDDGWVTITDAFTIQFPGQPRTWEEKLLNHFRR